MEGCAALLVSGESGDETRGLGRIASGMWSGGKRQDLLGHACSCSKSTFAFQDLLGHAAVQNPPLGSRVSWAMQLFKIHLWVPGSPGPCSCPESIAGFDEPWGRPESIAGFDGPWGRPESIAGFDGPWGRPESIAGFDWLLGLAAVQVPPLSFMLP
ncbi:hypothetical protein NDU88_000355 [Pleurodeles waltl]|uniref:Uncharacterized protein n=1 Tax=Pleurodeles waltl TaxID=8319 RepID=A0AAV7KXP1_PLEWA|nr:hypothetical protein NDU88_000355 [Pleurodeles waltl]